VFKECSKIFFILGIVIIFQCCNKIKVIPSSDKDEKPSIEKPYDNYTDQEKWFMLNNYKM
jgi:hypothetical protein